ncbi:MAG: amino acid adenylation domain-containing protein [bacterium]|nr:amino acid adenylation domain-containing protein [bacterium]
MIKLVQEYFSGSARRSPDHPAVVCRDESVTYGELDRQTNAWARDLQARGLRRGEFVVFFMKKGIPSIRSILTILKTDCAYVPVDVTSPPGRLADILETTGARFVLVDTKSEGILRDALGDDAAIEIVNVEGEPSGAPEPLTYRNLSIDIAYVLFTSGSTGKPKGVMISHQMILDYIDWCVETYDIRPTDRVANHAPLYFDNSTFDLYTSFKSGATLYLVHDALNTIMVKLIPWLDKNEISVFFCVPSVLNILLKSGKLAPGQFSKMRHVLAAGEALPPAVLGQWMDLYPHVQYTNMYGPTEITVDCTFHVVPERPAPDATHVPIGKPRENMEIFVAREDGTHSLEPGTEGELLVRGKSVSYGYLGDAEKTKAAFVQNPMHDRFHDPVYRTGDLVRVADDGGLLFLGRLDHQIKYMGNRIELGEIESALVALDGVRDGVVVFNDSPVVEEKCIGALVCLGDGADKEAVVAELRKRVPSYMVPRKVVVADAIPLTPNGKADRKATFGLVFED